MFPNKSTFYLPLSQIIVIITWDQRKRKIKLVRNHFDCNANLLWGIILLMNKTPPNGTSQRTMSFSKSTSKQVRKQTESKACYLGWITTLHRKTSLHFTVVKAVLVRVTESLSVNNNRNLFRVILVQHNGATRCVVNKRTSLLTSKKEP